MKTFLDLVAAEVLSTGQNDFSDLCIVLPNRRAGVFFREALARASDRAIWAPRVLSIEDFVFELSGRVKVDRTNLLFVFYDVYRKNVSDPQPLETFASWATTFLSDVNEVDLNLIDAHDIYGHLYSNERISRWNPDGSEPTDFQKRHLEFVSKLHGFYLSLRKSLEERRLAYQGMAFRQVAEDIDSVITSSSWSKVFFAGFNALTVAEERIIDSWLRSGKAEIRWDTDAFYVDDPIHEAGHYLRKYRSGLGTLKVGNDLKWKSTDLLSGSKTVQLIGVQRNVAQTQVAAALLSQKLNSDPSGLLSNTAVVLNDPKLLIPLLHALPTDLKGVNITMGYGLQNSQSATFVDKLFKLYERPSEQIGRFYHEDVSAILDDTLYMAMNREGAVGLRERIIREKRITLTIAELATDPLNALLFNDQMNSVEGFLSGLRAIIQAVHSKLEEKQEFQIEMEFLFLFDRLTSRLGELTNEFGCIESVRTLWAFWRQMVRSEQLDFVGEPLKGLQIMGMLETRNLDFEDVIMLGVNEGQLPSAAHSPSYFTFDVRRSFGLACQNERDAVTAYHFYRLLQRAKRIHLIYDQDTDSLGRGEVSRYVRQLKMEKGENIQLSEWNIRQEIPDRPFAVRLNIPKDSEALTKIGSLSEYGFSPSALNTFRSCSLKYYFKYVAGYKEPQELNEAIDHAMFGSAVHGALETLYKPYLNKPLSEETLKDFKLQARAALTEQLHIELAVEGELTGRNLLAFEVGSTYVERVIDHDMETTRQGLIITPLYFEHELNAEVILGDGTVTRIKGWADRIDQLSDGTIRIIDYKTGSFLKAAAIASIDDFDTTKADHAFQLLMYAYMYDQEHPGSLNLRPSVFYVRAQQVEFAVEVSEANVPMVGPELIVYAKDRLTEVIEALFDPADPFEQCSDPKTCEYCEFNQVCQR